MGLEDRKPLRLRSSNRTGDKAWHPATARRKCPRHAHPPVRLCLRAVRRRLERLPRCCLHVQPWAGEVHESGQSTDRLLQFCHARLERVGCSRRTRAFRALLVASAVGIVPRRALAADSAPGSPNATPFAPGPGAQPAASPPVSPPQAPPDRRPPPKPRVSEQVDYFTRRYEPAGFPLIGGSSDIGFQFGAVGTL